VTHSFSASSHENASDNVAISTAVFHALVKIQAQRPEWIKERHRAVPLVNQREKVIQFLQEHIEQQAEPDAQAKGITQFLKKILEPAVFQTQFYSRLMASVLAKAQPTPEQSAHQTTPQHVSQTITSANGHPGLQPLNLVNVAILLLDAENIDLPEAAENWLAQLCQHPISLKFAFGDWKTLGKRDQVLHHRGYHLIHVPSGKNHADSKMTVIGSSILVHLPSIKEAVVCSNDSDLQDLRNTLHFQGLTVRWLQRQEQQLTLTHCQTKAVALFQLPAPPQVPNKVEGINFLKEYLQSQTDCQTLFTQLTLEFSKNFGVPMTSFVKNYRLGKTPKAFLKQSSDFNVFNKEGDSHLYVSLSSAQSGNSQSPLDKQSQAFTIKKIKVVSVGITKRLLKEKNTDMVPVATVASAFYQQYGQAMTAVLGQLGQSKKISTFLASCNGIKTRKIGQQWLVMLDE
jgi:hypothetical protein